LTRKRTPAARGSAAAVGISAGVLVVASPPDAVRFIAPLGRAIEPLVHAPQAIQPARKAGERVINDAIFAHECAHAGPFADVGGGIDAAHPCELRNRTFAAELRARAIRCLRVRRSGLASIVVLRSAFALLFFGDANREVEIEIAAERG